MKKYKDVIAGVVVFIVASIYFLLTLGIKKISFIDPIVGSAMFPRIVAFILMLCGLVIIAQGLISLKEKDKKQKTHEKSLLEIADEAENEENVTDKVIERKGNIKVCLVLISFALFCFFLDKIGFCLSSFVYLWSQMIIMSHQKENRKSILFYGLLSLIISVVVFVLFRYGFGLILPKSKWF